MKPPVFLPTATVFFAATCLPTATFAQSTNVKTPNKNQSAKFKSAIFKGSGNLIESNSIASFIGGGQSNKIAPGVTNGVIGGGFGNIFTNHFTTVGGGEANNATGEGSTVAGGWLNTASGGWSTVAGGQTNTASGIYAAIGGGNANRASGNYATVPGGNLCFATNDGSFVWSGEPFETTSSWGDYTFTVRALGGARFYTAPGTVTYASLAAGSGAWTAMSDRYAKENFDDVNTSEVLAKVAAMPIKTWNYKTQADGIRHIGPTAQDFKSAFGVGESDTGITTVDADGVALAAIQGLVEELKERDKAMAARDEIIEELKAELKAVKERLNLLPPAP